MVYDFSFDWFRNKNGDRAMLQRNVGWAFHFLKGSGVIGADLADLVARADRAGEAMELAGLENSHHAWAELYDHLDRYPTLAAFFLDGCGSDIVLGFELSRAQRALLTREGKTFIDLRTHPVRFLPDYLFAAATNDPAIHERLVNLQPTRDYIDEHVRLVEALAARRYPKRLNPDLGVVFFAQTAVDSSRIRDGVIVDDLFILMQLERHLETRTPQNFYFKHHPHERVSPPLRNALRRLKAKETSTNTYDLLSVSGLYLMALSSSVCHEAQYFDTRPQVFLEPSEHFVRVGEASVPGDYLMMPTNAHSAAMWAHLCEGAPAPMAQYPAVQAPYRAASGLRWG